MKKLMAAWLLLSLMILAAVGQTSVQFRLTDPTFGISQTTNIEVILQAETLGQNQTVQLLPLTLYQFTDTNGFATFTNLFGSAISGFYHVTVPANSNPQGNGPFQSWQGDIWVQSTNLGLISASTIFNNFGAATIPAAGAAWTAAASDLRYSLSTNLYGNFVQIGQLNSTSNSLYAQIVSATNGQTSIVYSNSGAFTTPSQVTNIVNALAQTNAAPTLAAITNIAAVQASLQGAVSTNFTLTTSNSLATNWLAAMQGTNAALSAALQASNVTQAANLASASNVLAIGKQAFSVTLANISATGAFTNGIAGGQNLTLTTNFGGTVILINATNQTFLTNGMLALYATTNQNNIWYDTNGAAAAAVAVATNGFTTRFQPASQTLTNLSATGAMTNQIQSAIGIYLTTNVSGTIVSINASNQTFLTNGMLSQYAGTNQNNIWYDTNGAASAAVAGIAPIRYQAPSATLTNLSGTGAFTNGIAAGLNLTLTTNLAGTIITVNATNQTFLTNGMLSQYATTNQNNSWYDTNGAAAAAVAGIVPIRAQPPSQVLTNISNTGANTNVYIAGLSIYLTTNFSGTIQTINASNQTFLTNGMLNAYAPTNVLNGWYDTNGAALAAMANSILVSTNYANTNTAAQIQIALDFAATNTALPFVLTTNGVAQNLTIQKSLSFGSNTNLYLGTNWIQVSICGTPHASGIYQQIVNGTYTNITGVQNGFPGYQIVFTGGTYSLLNPAGQTLYLTNSVNGIWLVGPVGFNPAPYVSFIPVMNGGVILGDVYASNITAQIQAAQSSTTNFLLGANPASVVSGFTTNNLFSQSGTNAIDAEIARLASNPTNGISSITATNIVANYGSTIFIKNLNDIGTNTFLANPTISNATIMLQNPPLPSKGVEQIFSGSGNGNIVINNFNTPPFIEDYTTLIGGTNNDVLENTTFGTIIGGSNNIVGNFPTTAPRSSAIFNGYGDTIIGNYSTAIGQAVTINGDRSLVFSDGHPVTSTISNQVVIIATNGVAINTNSAGSNGLEVNGSIDSTIGFTINGVPIAGVGSGIATQNGIGTNTTLYGSNSISGISIYSVTNPLQASVTITSATGTEIIPLTDYYFNGGANVGVSGWFTLGAYTNSINPNIVIGTNLSLHDWSITFITNSGSDVNLYVSPGPSIANSLYQDIAGSNATVVIKRSVQPVNSYVLMNGVGPNGSEILFPSGDAIYSQSFSDAQVGTDSGISMGLGNGNFFGESFSFVSGAYNDIAGLRTLPIFGGAILGGTNNVIGDNRGNGSWSSILGGRNNLVTASNSASIGSGNTISNYGTFMWNDYSSGAKTSAVNNSVVFYTENGVMINTNNGGTNMLTVNGAVNINGAVTAGTFTGNGATLTGVNTNVFVAGANMTLTTNLGVVTITASSVLGGGNAATNNITTQVFTGPQQFNGTVQVKDSFVQALSNSASIDYHITYDPQGRVLERHQQEVTGTLFNNDFWLQQANTNATYGNLLDASHNYAAGYQNLRINFGGGLYNLYGDSGANGRCGAWVGMLYGTNGYNGMQQEFLCQAAQDFDQKDGIFARVFKIDGYSRMKVGFTPIADHTIFVPANATLQVMAPSVNVPQLVLEDAGTLSTANLVPGASTYSAGGQFTVTAAQPGIEYLWVSNSVVDTGHNGGDQISASTFTASSSIYRSGAAPLVLQGTANATITATVKVKPKGIRNNGGQYQVSQGSNTGFILAGAASYRDGSGLTNLAPIPPASVVYNGAPAVPYVITNDMKQYPFSAQTITNTIPPLLNHSDIITENETIVFSTLPSAFMIYIQQGSTNLTILSRTASMWAVPVDFDCSFQRSNSFLYFKGGIANCGGPIGSLQFGQDNSVLPIWKSIQYDPTSPVFIIYSNSVANSAVIGSSHVQTIIP